MHDIEPYYNWRHQYTAEEDERSPFFGRVYSEFEFSHTVYNYYIHPQWDEIGSRTLYLKLLFVDYDEHYAIIELIGEWNDTIESDIQTLKRNIIDHMLAQRITKFILIGENVMNFHSDTDDYYAEWFEELSDLNGWIVGVNFSEVCLREFRLVNIHHYILFEQEDHWRTLKPEHFYLKMDQLMRKLLG